MQLNGFCAIKRGLVPVTGPSFPLSGPSVPLTSPRFPLRGGLFNYLIVGHSPGFNCIFPRGASKNRSYLIYVLAGPRVSWSLPRNYKSYEKRQRTSLKLRKAWKSVTVSRGAIQTLAWVRSWACPGPSPGPKRSRPRFAMCFVLQRFGPIQIPRWGPSWPVLVPSCPRAFLPGLGLDGPKQISWSLLL